MEARLESVIAAAASAPSGDNTQPWRFEADGGTIALLLDERRDTSPMNAGQRMARIAAGAALENLVRAARDLGLRADLDPDPSPALARVRLVDEGDAGGRVAPHIGQIGQRSTNRRAYDGRPVEAEVLDRLIQETPELDGVRTHWLVGADRLKALAQAIGRGDAVMFGEPSMRDAFLSKVRFDRPSGEAVEDGLSIGSLELSASDRVALQVMRRLPDFVLKLAGVSVVFESKARSLVAGSSGLLAVSAPDDRPGTDLAVGRAAERAWLALTERGLAAQPMMSLPVLENALKHGDERLRTALGVARVTALLDDFRALVPELGGRRPAWLMRFGFAPPPSGRTGRLPIARVVSPAPARRGQGVAS
ncbi:MAG TPA: hypothetical protein VGH33_07135 [Isosphaeraceae bacterium]